MTLQFVIRTGADVWAEVRTSEGRFFVPFDASVFDLVQLVIRGGYWIEPHTSVTKSELGKGVQGIHQPEQ